MDTNDEFSGYHDELYRGHLRRFANKHAVPADVLDDIVVAEVGPKARVLNRVLQGEANATYSVANGSEQFVLRVSDKASSRFVNEAWAIAEARSVGVPAPEVVSTGTRQAHGERFSFSLQKQMPGKLLDSLLWVEHIDAGRARRIVEQAGELLARLHGVKMKRWGRLASPGVGASTEAEWHRAPISRALELAAGDATKFVSARELEAVAVLLGELPAQEPPVLLHCECAPKHIFVDADDVICGVIDFEDCEAGNPATEFAWWRYWFEGSAPVAWLRAGYETVRSLRCDERELDLFELRNAVFTLDYYVHNAKLDDYAEQSAARIKELLVRNG